MADSDKELRALQALRKIEYKHTACSSTQRVLASRCSELCNEQPGCRFLPPSCGELKKKDVISCCVRLGLNFFLFFFYLVYVAE